MSNHEKSVSLISVCYGLAHYPKNWKFGNRPWISTQDNGSQLKNPDISCAIFKLSLSIQKLNSQCVEGAKYVRILPLTPIILTFLVYFKGSFRNSIYYIFHIQYVLFEFSAD